MSAPTIGTHNHALLLTALKVLQDGCASGQALQTTWTNHVQQYGTQQGDGNYLGAYSSLGSTGPVLFVPAHIEAVPAIADDIRPPRAWPWIRLDVVDTEYIPGVTRVGLAKHRLELRTFMRNVRDTDPAFATTHQGSLTQGTLLAYAIHRVVRYTLAALILGASHTGTPYDGDNNRVDNVLQVGGATLDYMSDDLTHTRVVSYLDAFQRTTDPRGDTGIALA